MKLKGELILYSVAVGLNRGSILLYTPILISGLSLADFGQYNLILILMQILFPILCLNISSGIAREGADNKSRGAEVYKRVFKLPFVIFILSFCISLIFYYKRNYFGDVGELIFFSLSFGAVEALHNMQLSLLRITDNNKQYVYYSILKSGGFFIILFFLYRFQNHLVLTYILCVQLIWHLIIFIVFQYYIKSLNFFNSTTRIGNQDFKEIVKFSLYLIPHVLSLWAITASGRFFINMLYGKEALGKFSFIFTIGSIFMLFNSGLGLTLPQNFIRNPNFWISNNTKNKFVKYYTLAFIAVFTSCTIAILLLMHYTLFIPKFMDSNFLQYGLICLSFYFLGLYYYHSNILFYKKESKLLSLTTVIVAVFSFVSSFILINYFSLIGAAISFFLSYLFYYILISYMSLKVEKGIKLSFSYDLGYPLFTCALILLICIAI